MTKLELRGRVRGLAWASSFVDLCYEGWYWKQAAFIAWSALPRRDREPAHLNELADWLDYTTTDVFYKWKHRKPEIYERINTVVSDKLLEARPDVYQALVDVATQPIPKAHSDRKLYLEMVGDYTQKPIEVNWRQEAEAVGLNANQIFQQIVFQFATTVSPSFGSDDSRSLASGAEIDSSSSD